MRHFSCPVCRAAVSLCGEVGHVSRANLYIPMTLHPRTIGDLTGVVTSPRFDEADGILPLGKRRLPSLTAVFNGVRCYLQDDKGLGK